MEEEDESFGFCCGGLTYLWLISETTDASSQRCSLQPLLQDCFPTWGLHLLWASSLSTRSPVHPKLIIGKMIEDALIPKDFAYAAHHIENYF